MVPDGNSIWCYSEIDMLRNMHMCGGPLLMLTVTLGAVVSEVVVNLCEIDVSHPAVCGDGLY